MYMPLCVRESGVVRWHLSEGAALKPGDRLATLELDDPSAVTRAEVIFCTLSCAGNNTYIIGRGMYHRTNSVHF